MPESDLFSPCQLGPHSLSHRVVLAPLTRMRAFSAATPTALMAEYYAQRTSPGGLLIAEATVISPHGFPHHNVPAVYSDAQVEAWKMTTNSVHDKGGLIYLQLWHGGRASHRKLQPDEQLPGAPSAITPEGGGSLLPDGTRVPFEMPREMSIHEIQSTVSDYANATKLAMRAGFDGVEVHGANGYLPDQFLQDGSNHRTDAYGGSLENRARFLLELTDAVSAEIGADRVGVRISPNNPFNGISDSDPATTFSNITRELSKRGVGYLHVIEPRVRGNDDHEPGAPAVASRELRPLFDGKLIAAGGFTKESGNALIGEGVADLIAYGRHFISNPDLPERFRQGIALSPYDRSTFYGGDSHGYTDYSFAT